MNKQKHNNQDITAYLLGSLPDIETERFDELSFTDEDFAAALNSAEKDLVDAYINDELSGATLEKFKSYYLASPLRREKVEFAEAFQEFAKQSISEKPRNFAAEESKPKRTAAGFFSSLNIFKNQNPLLQWGFVAAALAFVVLGGLWIVSNRLGQPENRIATQSTPAPTNQELPKPIEERRSENSNAEREIAAANENTEQQNSEKEQTQKQPIPVPTRTPKQQPSLQPSIASLILAPSLRGSGSEIKNLFITEKTTDVAVQLQLESDDYAAYRVVLTDDAGSRNFWRSGTLKTKTKGNGKILNVSFSAKLLKSRIYSLTVSGINSEGEAEIISNYPFRAVLK